MVKFSVRENEDEPSSSRLLPKRRRIVRAFPPGPAPQPSPSPSRRDDSDESLDYSRGGGDYEDDDEDDDEDEMSDRYHDEHEGAESNSEDDYEEDGGDEREREEAVTRQENETPNLLRDNDYNKEESVDAILTDPDVLDCNVCLEPLSAPIFQCENGHIACASCCVKIKNKCHLCSWPIGYNRCRAIEKVIESVKVKCQNTKYGCQTFLRYDKKQDHEKLCSFVPCSCPFPNCNFVGCIEQLSQHFSNEHSAYRSTFKLDEGRAFYLKDDTKVHVLQGQPESFLFVLTNRSESLGNVITITRIGPVFFQNYMYAIAVKHQDSLLKLQAYTTTAQKIVNSPTHQTPFLLLPKEFFSGNQGVKISFCFLNRPKPG